MYMPSIFGENLFDDFFGDFYRPVKRREASHVLPRTGLMTTDVKEDDKGFELMIDLPGYQKEDIKAELKNGYMTISATKSSSNDAEDGKDENKYIRRERFYGSCSRSFFVGDDLTEKDIKAKFENGVLSVFVPKLEKKPEVEENKYIAIEG